MSSSACLQHPTADARWTCQLCGAAMCDTCAFHYPGNVHVCPECASSPRTQLTPSRRRMLIAAFLIAGWGTLGLAALFSGALAGLAERLGDKGIGILLMLFLYVPAAAGLGLAVAVRDRRVKTSGAVWGAILWNALIVAVLVLLEVVGNLS